VRWWGVQITGATVYNLNRIEEVDVGTDERPIFPPKILGTQVLSSPFDDIVPRALASAARDKEREAAATQAAKGPKATRYVPRGEGQSGRTTRHA
jgi:peptidyl-prolyl cis-trans isomerase SDCCAG10